VCSKKNHIFTFWNQKFGSGHEYDTCFVLFSWDYLIILVFFQVHMQGIAVGRAVDLTRFDQYEDLLRKLEEMFDIEGELCGSTKKWQVVYTDDEDDMMMVGDDPWL
jgi:hypothetical protein